VPLGRGVPNAELLPIDKLSRMLATEARRFPLDGVSYSGAKGLKRLRIQIAKRARVRRPPQEDDVYGDLGFGPRRPISAKAYDEAGLVLYCSSFSKTLAPGYRVGWIAPGRYAEKVQRLKALFNIATASPTQLAIAEFLTSGGYDRHLRAMRRTYAAQLAEVRAAIARWFPRGTRLTRPEGGFVLWVELPAEVDAFALYEQALRKGIAVAPGPLFTTGDRFRSCIRVSAAFWSERIREGIRAAGGIACAMARGADRVPVD